MYRYVYFDNFEIVKYRCSKIKLKKNMKSGDCFTLDEFDTI